MKCTMHRWYFALGSIEPTVATSPAHRSPTTSLTAKAGRLELKVPKPKDAVFESAVIERYRRREQSVEKSSTDMCLAGADSYETRSVIFTSNLEFSRWGDVFGDGDGRRGHRPHRPPRQDPPLPRRILPEQTLPHEINQTNNKTRNQPPSVFKLNADGVQIKCRTRPPQFDEIHLQQFAYRKSISVRCTALSPERKSC